MKPDMQNKYIMNGFILLLKNSYHHNNMMNFDMFQIKSIMLKRMFDILLKTNCLLNSKSLFARQKNQVNYNEHYIN